MDDKDYLYLWNMTEKGDQEMFESYDEFKKYVDKIHEDNPSNDVYKKRPLEGSIEETNESD